MCNRNNYFNVEYYFNLFWSVNNEYISTTTTWRGKMEKLTKTQKFTLEKWGYIDNHFTEDQMNEYIRSNSVVSSYKIYNENSKLIASYKKYGHQWDSPMWSEKSIDSISGRYRDYNIHRDEVKSIIARYLRLGYLVKSKGDAL
jgi:hypothetical protein